MSENRQIWAKSSEKGGGEPVRLSEHIKDVLEAFEGLKNRVSSELHEAIKLAIVCHDWGKVLPAFQIWTLKNSGYSPSYALYNVPHSLFSILWIDPQKLCEKVCDETLARFVVSAVAYHHWRESFFDLIISNNSDLGTLCAELESKGYIEQLKQNLEGEIRQIDTDWGNLISFNREMAHGLQNGVPFSEYALPPYQLYWLPKRTGIDDHALKKWIFIAGFLQRSDHFASYCEEDGEKLSTVELPVASFDETEKNVKEKIQKKAPSLDEKSIWQLQKIGELKHRNVILIAPTGYGKTEFAFLWSGGEKLFYTLPLRAAVNQIYERAKGIFGDDKTGLLHSDVDVFLLGDGGEGQASMKAYDLARQLSFPAIISTGDQFFPYALRPPGYEKIYATFSYSRLVIDEVQAYDPRAAAIVVKFIEDVIRMGGKFLLMTATLPKFVENEINASIGDDNYCVVNLYKEEKSRFEQIKKHQVKVELIENSAEDGQIDFSIPNEKLKEVLDIAKAGKQVLVIANTVKQAQKIFERLNELTKSTVDFSSLSDKLWLLHSRFTLEDRKQKEELLRQEFSNPKPDNESIGKILVATQVVEASLDLDADVLFTEVAPLDALVQRMGRVLRRYGPTSQPDKVPEPSEPNVIIWVFQQGLQSGKHYVYDADLVLLTLKLLKDKSYNQVTDYKNWLADKRKQKARVADRIAAVLEEIFATRSSAPKKSRRGKRSQSATSPTPASLEFQCTLSEYDKFDLVEKLYDLYDLPDDHDYIVEFRRTKDILDAGFMSDRLKDAQKMFREIFELAIIPVSRRDEFLKAVQDFFDRNGGDGKGLYARFKAEVLSKFVVPVPLSSAIIEGRDLQSVELWVRDWDNVEQRKRLQQWCRDIYFAKYNYDPAKGISLNVPVDYVDAAII